MNLSSTLKTFYCSRVLGCHQILAVVFILQLTPRCPSFSLYLSYPTLLLDNIEEYVQYIYVKCEL